MPAEAARWLQYVGPCRLNRISSRNGRKAMRIAVENGKVYSATQHSRSILSGLRSKEELGRSLFLGLARTAHLHHYIGPKSNQLPHGNAVYQLPDTHTVRQSGDVRNEDTLGLMCEILRKDRKPAIVQPYPSLATLHVMIGHFLLHFNQCAWCAQTFDIKLLELPSIVGNANRVH